MTQVHSKQQQHSSNQTQRDSYDRDKFKTLPTSNSLFAHLYEEGALSEKEVRKLREYKKIYLDSKTDIGAPRVTQSHIGSLAPKFGGQEPQKEDVYTLQDEQELVAFRDLSYGLHKTHKDLTVFVERLFEDHRNDLDFYRSWTPEQQKRGALVLKEFAGLIAL